MRAITSGGEGSERIPAAKTSFLTDEPTGLELGATRKAY